MTGHHPVSGGYVGLGRSVAGPTDPHRSDSPTVRYALASTSAPVAIADLQRLPDEARGLLPSEAELEAVIDDERDHRP